VLHSSDDRAAAVAVSGLAGGLLLLPFTIATPPAGVWFLVLLSGTAEAAYGLLLSEAYRRGQLSVTYPIGRGTAPFLVTLGAIFALAERPPAGALAGAVLLGAGLAVLAVTGRRSGSGPAVLFALMTGAAIATYSVIDARAVRQVNPLGYLGPCLLVQGLWVTIWLRGDRHRLRSAVGPGLRIAVGSLAAYLLVLFAFRRARAGGVATVREVSVLLGILLSGDRPGRRVWAGAALVVAGALAAAI
jgi:drug/metabolite transporter (DMT)-like permease